MHVSGVWGRECNDIHTEGSPKGRHASFQELLQLNSQGVDVVSKVEGGGGTM